jgi:flavin-dependent dehydrogenase
MTSSRASALLGFREPVDVLVVGGGPAGSATALTLARLGKSVLLLERTRYEDWRPGESLGPPGNAALDELGVRDRVLARGWKRCLGIEACWGSKAPYTQDFIFDPDGAGVQVERPEFDALLASAAADAGATLLLDSHLTRLERCVGGWDATLSSPGSERRCRVRFVVDASGRRAALSRRIGARRETIDRLVGLVAFCEPEPLDAHSTLLLEAVETGWWYSAPLTGSVVVAFMTDADLLNVSGRLTREAFRDRLTLAPRTAARVDGLSIGPLGVRSAASSWLRETTGDGWLAVGDAAAAYDPLTGTGLAHAMDSGIRAGLILADTLDGDDDAAGRYALETTAARRLYLSQRTEIYARERRWPSSPFWARRTTTT